MTVVYVLLGVAAEVGAGSKPNVALLESTSLFLNHIYPLSVGLYVLYNMCFSKVNMLLSDLIRE